MKRNNVRRILMILLACTFLICAGVVFSVKRKYIVNNRLNHYAATTYTERSEQEQTIEDDDKTAGNESVKREVVRAPIKVDFKALKELNPEIIGWIYCEDTVIDFPITQASDNDYYIDHGFDGKPNPCGSAFADALNRLSLQPAELLLDMGFTFFLRLTSSAGLSLILMAFTVCLAVTPLRPRTFADMKADKGRAAGRLLLQGLCLWASLRYFAFSVPLRQAACARANLEKTAASPRCT